MIYNVDKGVYCGDFSTASTIRKMTNERFPSFFVVITIYSIALDLSSSKN